MQHNISLSELKSHARILHWLQLFLPFILFFRTIKFSTRPFLTITTCDILTIDGTIIDAKIVFHKFAGGFEHLCAFLRFWENL